MTCLPFYFVFVLPVIFMIVTMFQVRLELPSCYLPSRSVASVEADSIVTYQASLLRLDHVLQASTAQRVISTTKQHIGKNIIRFYKLIYYVLITGIIILFLFWGFHHNYDLLKMSANMSTAHSSCYWIEFITNVICRSEHHQPWAWSALHWYWRVLSSRVRVSWELHLPQTLWLGLLRLRGLHSHVWHLSWR